MSPEQWNSARGNDRQYSMSTFSFISIPDRRPKISRSLLINVFCRFILFFIQSEPKLFLLLQVIGLTNLDESSKHSEKIYSTKDLTLSKQLVTFKDAALPVDKLNKLPLSTFSEKGFIIFLIVSKILFGVLDSLF